MTEHPIVDTDGVVRAACDLESLFRLLADDRRRQVAATLEAITDDCVDLEVVLAAVAAANGDSGPARDDWRVEFQHVHLPMFEDVGVMEYDEHDGTVRWYQCDVLTNVLEAVGANRSAIVR
ncbi:DUF7344 domain-containing protein [Natrarchaeobaculum sulfurireducens]|nr:ArsR family transcriptional regulator [Natrarchaeobaculum sulfurireducens]